MCALRQNKGLSKTIISGSIIIVIGLVIGSYIIALNAFVSPTSELRWDGVIEYINGVSFNPNDTVIISGYLEEGVQYWGIGTYYYFTTPESIRWILVVKDPNNMPIYLETDVVNNAFGNINIDDKSFVLPSEAVGGTYTVKLLIWTDLLPDGVSRTNEIHEITFEVI